MHRPFVTFSSWFYLWLALAIVLLPIKWLIAWIVAILVHEIFHYIALRLFGYPICQIHIGLHGVKMVTEESRGKSGVCCALAGPLSGFLLLFFVRWIPRIGICGLVLSVYNMLPFYPLDGGRALRCILQGVIKNGAAIKIHRGIEIAVFAAIVIMLLIIFILLGLKILPVIGIACLLAGKSIIKIPCKELQKRVQ